MESGINNSLRQLREKIAATFSLEELQAICFDLHVDWDELPGARKSNKIQSLIMEIGRNGRLQDLAVILRRERPMVHWPDDTVLVKSWAQLSENYPGRSATKIDHRSINRERARQSTDSGLHYFGELVILGLCIFAPIFIRSLGTQFLQLEDIKIIGQIAIGQLSQSQIFYISLVLTGLFFVPIHFLSKQSVAHISKIYDRFWPVDFDAKLTIRFGSFVFISIQLAGLITFLLFDANPGWYVLFPAVGTFLFLQVVGRKYL